MDTYKEIFLMQQAFATLFSLTNKLQIQGDKYIVHVTTRQFMAMTAVAHLPEHETTLNNIAKKLGTSKQSVKQLITIIENKGLVITVPSQEDKRAINVKITESGKQVLLEAAEKGLFFLENLFKDFTMEEIESLWSLLKKLYRFDGKEQDGFEQDSVLEMNENYHETQTRVIKEFERRRNQSKNRGLEDEE
ncbi:MarR family winged helix-turn-helix transcriptional regulator [Paenibacillus sp. N3.4]|uniref:MarR family winged helix-turn-helix transcriptional regulator n=1 Tax=Paenibacillus sp. N3.4 TaxID=2603222 RepID=UPI0011C8C562|nr:MarR family transcriptional regulator [Paenibacillus sp. N3.4]TXK80697.1 MarR family transcriptional regulator [Paenibacillus sp. N3.4]